MATNTTTTTLQDAYEDYRFSILEHSEQTQIWITRRLSRFVAWLGGDTDLEHIKATDIRKYVEHLKTRPNEHTGALLSSHTVHGHARIIRAFLNWCYAEELISTNPTKRFTMPRTEKKVIETLAPEHIRAMFAACEREYTPELVARDRAILSLLLDTGIRANELCSLTLENVHLDTQDAYLTVSGKGFKQREVGLGKQSRTTLHKYIRRYRIAPEDNPHVFLSRFKESMTVNGLDQMLYRLAAWCHVKVRVSAHVWRHTYAMQYLKNGGDVYKLSRLMGHVGISVTEGYVRSLNQREARNGLSVLDSL
jgi:site-specific recombinase XerD